MYKNDKVYKNKVYILNIICQKKLYYLKAASIEKLLII